MLRICSKALYLVPKGKQSKSTCRPKGRNGPEESPAQHKNQYYRRRIDNEQPQMNPLRRLSKNAKHNCVRRVDSGQLHIVGELIRRDALENQLTGVGVFPFVAFEGDIEESHPHHRGQCENYPERRPYPQLRPFAPALCIVHCSLPQNNVPCNRPLSQVPQRFELLARLLVEFRPLGCHIRLLCLRNLRIRGEFRM